MPRLLDVVVFQYQTSFVGLERFHVFVVDFSVPTSGTLHITVDWTFSADDIDLSLSNPSCDDTALRAGICKVFAADSSNAKPAQLTLPTGATSYRLFVVNRGPGSESGTILVTVTQSGLVS